MGQKNTRGEGIYATHEPRNKKPDGWKGHYKLYKSP